MFIILALVVFVVAIIVGLIENRKGRNNISSGISSGTGLPMDTYKEIDRRYNASLERQKQRNITKGAVVGGIVAGPAGAVVGAMKAKEKNEQSK